MPTLPFTERNGVKIDYEVVGTGPAIVKLPGLGSDIEMSRINGWLASGLPHHQLVLIDPRGHGKSDKPTRPGDHRIEEYRDDVIAVLDRIKVERAVFWGISNGAEVACALASAYPERVTAIIDLDGWDDRDLCDSPLKEESLEFAKSIRARGWSAVIKQAAKSNGFDPESPLIQEFQRADTNMTALEVEAWTEWKGPLSILPRLSMPILRILNGKRKSEEIERIKQQVGTSTELHVIPGLSYMQLCLIRKHTEDLVHDFLARVD